MKAITDTVSRTMAKTVITSPKTIASATVKRTVVRALTLRTTDSTVSVACTVQSRSGAGAGVVGEVIPAHYRWRPVVQDAAGGNASPGRRALAAGVGAVVAAIGALIFGEYDFSGATPYLGGVLFGLVVAESVLTVARRGTRLLAIVAAVESGAGLAWAAWISSGRGIAPIGASGYAAVAIGAAVAGVWVALPSRSRARSRRAAPPAPEPPDGLPRA